MHTWTIYEPSWGKASMLFLNNLVSSDQTIFHIISLCADVIVFIYPIVLVIFYLYGYKHKFSWFKEGSIKIILGVAIAMIMTIIIQQFVWKNRPETLPGLDLILQHLPTISFPSDHATVGFAMGMGSLLFGITTRKYFSHDIFYNTGLVLIGLGALMSLSRVAVAVHWPTDVIVGGMVGIIGAYIAYKFKLFDKISYLISQIIDRVLSAFWKV